MNKCMLFELGTAPITLRIISAYIPKEADSTVLAFEYWQGDDIGREPQKAVYCVDAAGDTAVWLDWQKSFENEPQRRYLFDEKSKSKSEGVMYAGWPPKIRSTSADIAIKEIKRIARVELKQFQKQVQKPELKNTLAKAIRAATRLEYERAVGAWLLKRKTDSKASIPAPKLDAIKTKVKELRASEIMTIAFVAELSRGWENSE